MLNIKSIIEGSLKLPMNSLNSNPMKLKRSCIDFFKTFLKYLDINITGEGVVSLSK